MPKSNERSQAHFRIRLCIRIVVVFFVALWTGCEKKILQLQRVIESGKLKVLTRFDHSTYYETGDGYSGLEHDLVQLFAKRLGVETEFIIPGTFNEILSGISRGKADIAAAGLSITERRKESMRFAPSYTSITEQIIYRAGTRRPRKVTDLADGILEVVHGSTHVESLQRLKEKNPSLDWEVNSELNSESLLYLLNEGLIDYTVSNSNQFILTRRFYPNLHAAFDVSPPRPLAWALPKSDDTSLYDEVVKFFNAIERDKIVHQLMERHYGHATSLGYVDNCTFRLHVKRRLPKFLRQFKASAHKFSIDWRLLAAIGYQESHWRVDAISPTGVSGIMMLTQGTAKQLGLTDRNDPTQSISGGARYFMQRKKKIPKRIAEPDRTWLALAAYNVGFGHLEDARILTEMQGYNPDKWMYVKESLPLLSQEKWHRQTKYGYARGREPVAFVENIRGYYDLLVWLTQKNGMAKKGMAVTKLQNDKVI